jgi:N-methylhydantoinase B
MPFATAGVVDEWLLELVRANVRDPVQVQGDLYALAACNEIGGRRIIEMLDETGIDDLDELGAFIIDSTSRAMRESINRLPKGTVSNPMTIDGFDRPIELVASLTVGDGEIVVTSPGPRPTRTTASTVPSATPTPTRRSGSSASWPPSFRTMPARSRPW